MRRLRKIIKLLNFCFLFLILLALVYFSLIETPYRPITLTSTPEHYLLPQVIAHKAKHPEHPSNSIEGIAALRGEQIKGIEIDVQNTKDGVPVLFHALDLKDGSTGDGPVSAMQFSELQKLFLTKEGKTTSSKIPSLESVLRNYCGEMLIILDIKAFTILDQSITEKAVELVQKYHCQNSVIFDALNPAILLKVRTLDPRIPVSISFLEDNTATAEETQGQLDKIPTFLRWRITLNILRALILPDYLSPRFSVPSERIELLARLGYPLIAWTVDDVELSNRLFNFGARSVISNLPLQLKAEIQQVVVDDASRLNASAVKSVVAVKTKEEIQAALKYARSLGLKVSIAGKRHSMGGQTIVPGGLVIDMNSMNAIGFDEATGLLTAQAGASWKDIQDLLDKYGRSVQVMQSDNIFSLGGSISVNAHGWQPNRSPLAETIKKFELILADGRVVRCKRPYRTVCRAALGGYGLVGVIAEATLATTENVALKHVSHYIPTHQLVAEIRKHLQQPQLELLYARLRVDKSEFLNEAGVHAFYRIETSPTTLPNVQTEALVRAKRAVFRLSERSDSGKLARWIAERDILETVDSKFQPHLVTRNQIMYSDFQFIWPADFSKHDILHEYFIPLDKAHIFIDELRTITQKHQQNLLNVTIRHLLADQDSLLPYAKQEMLSFVLLFSQEGGAAAEEDMHIYTQELIDSVLELNGTFYLPYRRHYTKEQLLSAYPQLENFLKVKLDNDPELIFQNMLWRTFSSTDS